MDGRGWILAVIWEYVPPFMLIPRFIVSMREYYALVVQATMIADLPLRLA